MSEKKDVVSIVPLANFDSETESIQLENDLCLRRIDANELKGLIQKAVGYRFPLENALIDVKYVIEKKWQTGEFRLWDESCPYASDIVLALKLLKAGDVNTPTAFLLDLLGKSYSVSNTSPRVSLGNPYFLKQKEVSNFKRLWQNLQSVEKEKPHLEFPLFQFIRAFEENSPENIITDFVTAFESLVFHRGEKTPKPYGRTIGIAIGMLLGRNEKERTEIEKELEDAYSMRNAIVHGHLRKKLRKYDDRSGTQLLFKVEDYLRRSLRRFLEE